MNISRILTAVAVAAIITGCGGKTTEERAQEYLDIARVHYNKGEYDKALATIDSLKKNCPEAIKARKAALRLRQETELKRAQAAVQAMDQALQAAETEYKQTTDSVERLKKSGEITAAQLKAATLARMRRDSIKTRFEVECAKIRYIKQKMNGQ